jgi:uncharacterized protein (TIGR03118 family)
MFRTGGKIVMSLSTRLKIFAIPALTLFLATSALAQYTRTDLVTDTGVGGTLLDKTLKNAWGLTALPTSPFWVSDNTTGQSTLYTGEGGKIGLTVAIPAANGGPGTPTGIVGNTTASDFVVSENGKSGKALFIFATQDGTISGWSPVVAPPKAGVSHATIAPDRSGAGASYTGLAIGSSKGQNFLFAADGGPNRRVDVFDSTFTLMDLGPDAFDDPGIPRNFAPYGIQVTTATASDGTQTQTVWVTYTALNKAQGGFVDSFTTAGVLIRHFAANGPLHSPWGVAIAPADFGPMSNALLITNNISRGRINAFDPGSGAFLGPLRDATGQPIEIDGLWGIQFGHDGGPNGAHNQLFFTAGSNNYANGIFGVITLDQ